MPDVLRGDFHCHMNGNGQHNRWSNIEALAKMALANGYNAIMLGCHDFVCPKDLAVRCTDTFGLTVVRGAEISTNGGHLLAYNLDKVPSYIHADNHHLVEIKFAVAVVKGLGGKTVMAHPYPKADRFPWANRFEEVAEKLDGAEIRNHKSYMRDKIVEFDHVRLHPHLKLFSGSDCHPWEGDTMESDYAMEIDRAWFGELV
jgi:predicted metal-dependent phosphoesterase TrpH